VNRKAVIAAIGALALALALAAYWVLQRPSSAPGPGAATVPASGKATTAIPSRDSRPSPAKPGVPIESGTARRPAAGANPSPPLPPVGAPIREVVAQLKEAAEAGDVIAACRLGTELTRCHQLRQADAADNTSMQLQMVKPGTPEEAAVRSGIEERARLIAPVRLACDGVTKEQADSAFRYLLRAAHGGNLAAMTQFAIAPPLPQNVLEDLEGWAAYRDHAPTFFDRAIRAGDLRAAFVAQFHMVAGIGVAGGTALPRDHQRAAALAHAILPSLDADGVRMVNNMLEMLRADKSIDWARARREGEAMQRDYFSRAPRTSISIVGMPEPQRCAE
jgi:hypothetical protein